MTSARRLLLFGLAGLFAAANASAQAADQALGRVLVMPFDNVTHDGRIIWIGEASAVLLADDLNAFGVNAITREERRQALEVLQVPPTVSKFSRKISASAFVSGWMKFVFTRLRFAGASCFV